MKLAISLLLVASSAVQMTWGQGRGTQTPEEPLPFSWEECSDGGSCNSQSGYIVLDSNWRWTHDRSTTTNCYTGNEWDPTLCPDSSTCTANCAIDGVSSGDWGGTYGATSSGSELSLRFVTQGPYSTNIGSRTYLLDSDRTNYRMFQLLNREFTFTVDNSGLDCGLNGALYFVEMMRDGGLSEYGSNEAGAAYGTGYCDAQCPHDIKWINGEANSDDWDPSDNDANSGTGKYGSCCSELDIWEANKESQAFTTHPCDVDEQTRCEGTECGDNDSDERYDGLCDKDGCDFASYRLGDQDFYGPGKLVDSNREVTVVTQFITSDGTDSGDLVEVRRFYVQDGEKIENSVTLVPGVDQQYDSITDEFCADVKGAFGDVDDHGEKGGLSALGDAMGRGMVLVMSLWDDHEAFMLWLDSNYPEGSDPGTPGNLRGPCPEDSGRPEDVEAQQASATVYFKDIKFGPIGSTTEFS